MGRTATPRFFRSIAHATIAINEAPADSLLSLRDISRTAVYVVPAVRGDRNRAAGPREAAYVLAMPPEDHDGLGARMTTTVYPYFVRGLADECRCTLGNPRNRRYARWTLGIAGPFCFWPNATTTNGLPERCAMAASRVSSLLGTGVSHHRNGLAVCIEATITDDMRMVLIRKEYTRVTSRA